MPSVLRFFLLILAFASLGMARKQAVTVRFYAEANARDGASFSRPIKVGQPPREIYIESIPSINEHNLKAIYPFQASDGSWGAYFQLDQKGRIDLEVVSTQRRGTVMVAFITTAKGVHQVIDMIVDKPILDGIIAIPRGMTELEVAALTKEYPIMGQAKRKK